MGFWDDGASMSGIEDSTRLVICGEKEDQREAAVAKIKELQEVEAKWEEKKDDKKWDDKKDDKKWDDKKDDKKKEDKWWEKKDEEKDDKWAMKDDDKKYEKWWEK